jgi:hypothetical protein
MAEWRGKFVAKPNQQQLRARAPVFGRSRLTMILRMIEGRKEVDRERIPLKMLRKDICSR